MKKRGVNNRKYRSISIKMYEEDDHMLSDVLVLQHRTTTDNTFIYDVIKFKGNHFEFIPICKELSILRKKSKISEIAKNKMKELIEKKPSISSRELKCITGYHWSMINRHYMSLKKIYR